MLPFSGEIMRSAILRESHSIYGGSRIESGPILTGRISTVAHVRIYDVFGFFQSSFSAVVKSMVDSGRASPEEAAFIATMKERRKLRRRHRTDQSTERIAAPGAHDGRLAQWLRRNRVALAPFWHGAGAAASALIEAEKLKEHYAQDIAASNILREQDAAHHAYFGGRIELLKQGYLEGGELQVYDIASAYPAAMAQFPSLAGGHGSIGTARNSGRIHLLSFVKQLKPLRRFQCSKYDINSRSMRNSIRMFGRPSSFPFIPFLTATSGAAFYSPRAATAGSCGMTRWPQLHGLSASFPTSRSVTNKQTE